MNSNCAFHGPVLFGSAELAKISGATERDGNNAALVN